MAAHLRIRLDPVVLARALDELTRRHEVLRSHFEYDGALRQVIDPASPAALRHEDLGQLEPAEREHQLEHLLREFAAEPFDVTHGPLSRFLLVTTGATSVFALSIHHLVFDGWSAGVLVSELAAAYSALAAGRPTPFDKAPPRFADHAHWSANPARCAARRADVAHVVDRLATVWPGDPLPLDFPPPPRPSFRGAKVPLELPCDLTAAVLATARDTGATPFAVVLTALAAALTPPEQTAGVVIGITPSSRPYPEAAGMIGCFVDTVLVPVRLDGQVAFADAVGRVRDDLLDLFAHANTPLEEVLAELRARGVRARAQVVLTLQNSPMELPEIVESVQTIDNGTAKFDLVLNLTQDATVTGPALHGWWEYSTDVLRAASVRELSARLVAVLSAGCARPTTPMDDLRALGCDPDPTAKLSESAWPLLTLPAAP